MKNLWSKPGLIWEFILLDIKAKYKDSYLGLLWSLVHPLLMIGIYLFLFRVVSRPRWEFAPGAGSAPYVLILFCGMIVFNVLGESLVRAPMLIVSCPNYVKKIIFPVEILPISVVGSACLRFLPSLAVLLVGMLVWGQTPSWRFALLPLILLPLLLVSLGLSWLLASWGVFFRDLAHAMPFIVQIAFFLSPILYPVSAVPASVRPFYKLNLLTVIVGETRDVLLFGESIDWTAWAVASLIAAFICAAGYRVFMASKPAFADAL